MRQITQRHRIAAKSLGMDAGKFADTLDEAKLEIRVKFMDSGNPKLMEMALADDETLDNFLREALKHEKSSL